MGRCSTLLNIISGVKLDLVCVTNKYEAKLSDKIKTQIIPFTRQRTNRSNTRIHGDKNITSDRRQLNFFPLT